ncbi:MAG: helix-turn-helix transcriptional regulator [Clostridiales bacterium]|nr:helix-turn-helix transcriptional regulator [Clostridiales bacterium]
MTIQTYLNSKRMDYTKNQLLKNKKITDVALQLGNTNIYNFSRAFKKHVGISPELFKKEQK